VPASKICDTVSHYLEKTGLVPASALRRDAAAGLERPRGVLELPHQLAYGESVHAIWQQLREVIRPDRHRTGNGLGLLGQVRRSEVDMVVSVGARAGGTVSGRTPRRAACARADREVSIPMNQPTFSLLVRQATWEAEDVLSLCLVDPNGVELPEWEPGAHLDVVLPSGLVRQYSLCGDPAERHSYTIAVLKEQAGRGGSREIHETPLVGRTLTARGPRNHFRLVDAPDYLFVAGGVGITPILAMVRQVSRSAANWRLVYGGRSRRSMAFTDELVRLGADRVELVPQDERGLLDVDAIVGAAGPPTAVYCCGPEGLIRAVEQRCAGVDLHVERFTGGTATATPLVPADPQTADSFEVELRRTGRTLTVPADRSILDVVREVAPDVLWSCEEGYCGTCETKVLEGTPEHRDTLLTEREREESETMMICVGRSRSPRLVLDL
jgi:ferredoxin-NADP reductase